MTAESSVTVPALLKLLSLYPWTRPILWVPSGCGTARSAWRCAA
ncbi:hypothetical protein DESPIG_03176, partial [Desulfovibrio piger ATCC 29098]